MTNPQRHSMYAATSSRRSRLARLCCRSGLLPIAGRLRGLLDRDVRILAYHRVLESAEPEGFSFDLDLVSASAEAFREQMLLVKRRYRPMRFDELADCVDRDKPLPRQALLVSFDDGYNDNFTIAYPVLRDLGMSAMFFVSTGHIDSGMPYAYDWFVHMLCSTKLDQLELPELGVDMQLPEALDARRELARVLLDRIKVLDALAQRQLICRLEQEWGLPREAGHPRCRPMDWAQLREMRQGGMEVGSHGVDHHMLAKLPRDEMTREIEGSKLALERELGGGIEVLSYPVGGPDAYDTQVMQAARDAGFRLACSYRAGTDSASRESRYQLCRLPVERYMDAAWFEAMVAVPEVFSYPSRHRQG